MFRRKICKNTSWHDDAGVWGVLIKLANGWQFALPPTPSTTTSSVTVEARKFEGRDSGRRARVVLAQKNNQKDDDQNSTGANIHDSLHRVAHPRRGSSSTRQWSIGALAHAGVCVPANIARNTRRCRPSGKQPVITGAQAASTSNCCQAGRFSRTLGDPITFSSSSMLISLNSPLNLAGP